MTSLSLLADKTVYAKGRGVIINYKASFLKSLEPSHGVLQLLNNFYSVLLLHLLKPLFSVFHGLQALSIFLF